MQELKRGSSAERIAKVKPGKERDNKVFRLEDEGQLTTWQGRKGRERSTSSTRSETGMRLCSPEGGEGRPRTVVSGPIWAHMDNILKSFILTTQCFYVVLMA